MQHFSNVLLFSGWYWLLISSISVNLEILGETKGNEQEYKKKRELVISKYDTCDHFLVYIRTLPSIIILFQAYILNSIINITR